MQVIARKIEAEPGKPCCGEQRREGGRKHSRWSEEKNGSVPHKIQNSQQPLCVPQAKEPHAPKQARISPLADVARLKNPPPCSSLDRKPFMDGCRQSKVSSLNAVVPDNSLQGDGANLFSGNQEVDARGGAAWNDDLTMNEDLRAATLNLEKSLSQLKKQQQLHLMQQQMMVLPSDSYQDVDRQLLPSSFDGCKRLSESPSQSQELGCDGNSRPATRLLDHSLYLLGLSHQTRAMESDPIDLSEVLDYSIQTREENGALRCARDGCPVPCARDGCAVPCARDKGKALSPCPAEDPFYFDAAEGPCQSSAGVDIDNFDYQHRKSINRRRNSVIPCGILESPPNAMFSEENFVYDLSLPATKPSIAMDKAVSSQCDYLLPPSSGQPLELKFLEKTCEAPEDLSIAAPSLNVLPFSGSDSLINKCAEIESCYSSLKDQNSLSTQCNGAVEKMFAPISSAGQSDATSRDTSNCLPSKEYEVHAQNSSPKVTASGFFSKNSQKTLLVSSPGVQMRSSEHPKETGVTVKSGKSKPSKNSAAGKGRRSISKSSPGLYCSICDLSFKVKISFDRHMIGHTQHQCSLCSLSLGSYKALCKHSLNAHKVRLKAKRYGCQKCGKSFLKKIHLLKHSVKVHPEAHQCAKCGEAHSSAVELSEHAALCHSSHKCDLCGQTFEKRKHFLRHMQGHERNSCRWCKDSFSTKGRLHAHVKAHHPHEFKSSSECLEESVSKSAAAFPLLPRHSCSLCPRHFTRPSLLRDHVNAVHSGN